MEAKQTQERTVPFYACEHGVPGGCSKDPQTKTVEGHFGPKQITREDFIKRWSSHFNQMFNLANTTAEYEELKQVSQRVSELAGASWDRIK